MAIENDAMNLSSKQKQSYYLSHKTSYFNRRSILTPFRSRCHLSRPDGGRG